jgi:hypothetical protein
VIAPGEAAISSKFFQVISRPYAATVAVLFKVLFKVLFVLLPIVLFTVAF